MTENKTEKSLRWVVNQIPDFEPQNNEEKMLLAIKRYCKVGANEIKRLEAENAELKEKWNNLRCVYSFDGEIMEYCVNGPCPNHRSVSEVREENAELRARLEKAVELPVECYSKVWYLNIVPTISLKSNTIYEGTLVGYHIAPINGIIYFIAEIRIENEYGVTKLPNAEKDYNKTWFTDRAKAEARLAELKGEKE